MGHDQARQRPADRIQRNPCILREQREPDRSARQIFEEFGTELQRMIAPRLRSRASRDPFDQADHRRPHPRHHHDAEPDQRAYRRDRPRRHQQRNGRRGQHRAAQVFQHFPAAHRRQASSLADDPWQQLPVTTRPAMRPRRCDFGVRRKILEQRDVGHQRAANVQTLEQIVAQQRVLRHASGQSGFESLYVVQTLAGEQALAEYILIEIRDCGGIGIETAAAGDDRAIQRALFAGGQQRRDPRLQHAIATHDPTRRRIEHRAIERMSGNSDEIAGHSDRHARVGIQCEHIAHIRRHIHRPTARCDERGGAFAEQQVVQLGELAALALPAHEAALLLVPLPATMEQIEARFVCGRSLVGRIQCGDGVRGHREQRRIFIEGRRRRVDAVGKQGEPQLCIRIGQRVDLQRMRELRDIGRAAQHDGHHDQGLELCRDAALQREPRQMAWRKSTHPDPIDEPDGQLGSRYQCEPCQEPGRRRSPVRVWQAPVHGRRGESPGDDQHAAAVQKLRVPNHLPLQSLQWRGSIADDGLELHSA